MKKLKWFTLVEILIVIVIIGILIWALVPRMQSAQWRARDVARKNDLSQLQSAIVTSQQDKWVWPGITWALGWTWINSIKNELETAWMSSVPRDPLTSTKVFWLWSVTTVISTWEYGYLVWKKNWTAKAWFVLMAKTEIEWWSNWVVCNSWTYRNTLQWGVINSGNDLSKISICTSFVKTGSSGTCSVTWWICTYKEDWELRYILIY